jgi:hypothetical protein
MARDAGKPFLADGSRKKEIWVLIKHRLECFRRVPGRCKLSMITAPVFIVISQELWENCTMDRIN